MNWSEFKSIIEEAGLTPKECASNHWQILGGIRPVNLHLDQRGKLACVYINGMSKGMRSPNVSLETAIAAAKYGAIQPEVCEDRPSRKQMRKLRSEVYDTEKNCHWCAKALAWGETTLDHKIPLAKGGTNRRDNLCISCKECNSEKSDQATWPEVTRARAVDQVFSEMGAIV